MKDGSGPGSTGVSRDDLFEEYVRWCLQLRTESEPCRDGSLLTRVRALLRKEPTEPDGVFTVLPFYQALTEVAEEPNWTRHLSAFIKAAELLEMLCVNLFLQPWRKEFKTLKCFTGAFVYHLLPVFSTPMLQLVLAHIGYLPDPESSCSQYRLSPDVNPDKTMQVGFELMLARVECLHHMELLENNQLSAEESVDLLQRRTTEMKTHKQSEDKSRHQREDNKDRAEKLHTGYLRPQPKTGRHGYHMSGIDQSIMEMQKNYPDLAIRGRPILSDKPQLPPPYRLSNDEGAAPPDGGGSTSNNDRGGGPNNRDRRMGGRAHWVQADQNQESDDGAAGRDLEDKTQEGNTEDEKETETEDDKLFNDHHYVLL